MIKIDKDVFVRDQYGVRVRVFVAGTEVDEALYKAALSREKEVKAEVAQETAKPVKEDTPMENKMLPEQPEEVVEIKTEEVKEPEKPKAEKAKPAKK